MTVTLPSPEQLFVITHTHSKTLWGLHFDMAHQGRKTQIVAFRNHHDAQEIARRLWIHRLKAHRWPNTIIQDKPLMMASPHDIIMTSPSPLAIDEVDLTWLLDRLALSSAALSVVDDITDSDNISFDLKYMESIVPPTKQVSWLQKLYNRPPAKKQ